MSANQTKQKQSVFRETGSAKLNRRPFFNKKQEDIDIPDGDVEYGRMLYSDLCAGCHNYIGYGPNLINIYGAKGCNQKNFVRYSSKSKGLSARKWSKEKLFTMLENPQAVFGWESAMLFDGIKDPYIRASIVEYIHYMRLAHHERVLPKPYVYQ